MIKVITKDIHVIGLSLKTKTTNAHGQSSIDCKNLWHAFDEGKYLAAIPGKLSDEIYGVYYQYEGDSTKPFSYFVGCKVKEGSAPHADLVTLTIPAGTYEKISATGKMPDCVIKAWKDIWAGHHARTYQYDFEVYDERSKDWSNAEVDVYISVED